MYKTIFTYKKKNEVLLVVQYINYFFILIRLGFKTKTTLKFNFWLPWFVYFKFNNYMKERSM